MDTILEVAVAMFPYVIAVVVVVIAYSALNVAKGFLAANPDAPGVGVDDVAWVAVNAVEQMFFEKDGAFKLNEALNFVGRLFPELEREELRFWIEAAVKQMNDSKVV